MLELFQILYCNYANTLRVYNVGVYVTEREGNMERINKRRNKTLVI